MASQQLHTALNWLDREDIVGILEGISIQCYDSESDQVLRDAVLQNIEDGTLDESDVIDVHEMAAQKRR